jgi:hypothetical protein
MALPLVVALAASACSYGTPATTRFNYLSHKVASIRGQTREFARMLVTVVREPELPGFRTQKLPGAYTSADLVLSNTSTSLLTANLSKALSIATGTTQATGVYTALRPGSGYKLTCTLKNNSTSVGSGYADSITLVAGVNTVTIIIGVLGDIKISTSGNNNAVGDANEWIIVKGDTYTFDTGFDSNEKTKSTSPSSSLKMKVILGSAIYDPNGDSSQTNRIVDEETDNFNTWQLITGTSANSTAEPGYNKDELTVAGGSSITFRLASGSAIVGESVLSPVRVIEGSSLNLQLQ